jgi:tetratricopeptide (TPR) repeat protein
MSKIAQRIDQAVMLTRNKEYLAALTEFMEIYGGEEPPTILMTTKTATGLSYFGLCLALITRKFKPAIDLCKRALELQFYSGDHHANLAQVYLAAGNRKKALEAVEAGLRIHPEDDYLIAVRRSLGVRARPAVPFLGRSNPINVSLGQARHARKIADREAKRKKK